MLNIFVPEDGPQLKKILVGLTLFDSITNGETIVLARSGQIGENTPLEPPELEVELEDELEAHVDFVTVVLFNVTAAMRARSLPLTVELPLSVID